MILLSKGDKRTSNSFKEGCNGRNQMETCYTLYRAGVLRSRWLLHGTIAWQEQGLHSQALLIQILQQMSTGILCGSSYHYIHWLNATKAPTAMFSFSSCRLLDELCCLYSLGPSKKYIIDRLYRRNGYSQSFSSSVMGLPEPHPLYPSSSITSITSSDSANAAAVSPRTLTAVMKQI